ncbi:hypothetical protein ACFCZR_24585 [Streptomyces rubiginosohelvolus]|uniref:hypothetical protein n=1 Tax=Streptomyces rubiginosohelvolus TaxID=67362 RepID=UPI0035E256E8
MQNWAVVPNRGAADRIGREVAKTLHQWGYRPKDDQPQRVVELLLRSADQDGGRRVSLHLADDEDLNQVMLLALSHRQDMPPGDDDQVLRDAEHMRALAALGVRDVGVETEPRGRRWWAGLDLPRPGRDLELGAQRSRALASGPKKLEGPPVPA